jgi:hypothetical protein
MQDEGDEFRLPDHVLATDELRRSKSNRAAFTSLPRNPVTFVLDDVTQLQSRRHFPPVRRLHGGAPDRLPHGGLAAEA